MQNHTVKLTVPGRFAEDFRAASAYELAAEGRLVLKDRAELHDALEGPESREERLLESRAESLDLSLRMLATDAGIYRQLGTEGTDDIAIDIEDRYGCVAHVVETSPAISWVPSREGAGLRADRPPARGEAP